MRRMFLKTIVIAFAGLCSTAFGIEFLNKPEETTPTKESKVDILLFSATWCGPCQSMKARLKRDGLYKYVTLMDCTEGKMFAKYAKTYKFRGVPTLIVLIDGEEVARNDRLSASDLIRKYAPK